MSSETYVEFQLQQMIMRYFNINEEMGSKVKVHESSFKI